MAKRETFTVDVANWPSPIGVQLRFERRRRAGREVPLPPSGGPVATDVYPHKPIPTANRRRPSPGRGPLVWEVYRTSDEKLMYTVRGSREDASDAMEIVLLAERDPYSFYLRLRGTKLGGRVFPAGV